LQLAIGPDKLFHLGPQPGVRFQQIFAGWLRVAVPRIPLLLVLSAAVCARLPVALFRHFSHLSKPSWTPPEPEANGIGITIPLRQPRFSEPLDGCNTAGSGRAALTCGRN